MSQARERRGLVGLARFRRLSTAQIGQLIAEGASDHGRAVAAWRILRQLRRRGLVAGGARLVGGPGGGSARAVYRLTERGARYLSSVAPGLRAPRATRRDTSVEHALLAADIYLAFLRAARTHAGHAVSDWEPDWRTSELLGSSRVVPDGHFVYSSGEWELGVFVEADLGTERPVRFARKVAEYLAVLRHGAWRAHLRAWPLVVTVAPTLVRATALRRVTEGVLERQRDGERLRRIAEFDFAALPDLVGREGPLGPIWQVAGREGCHQLITLDLQGVPAIEGPASDGPGDIAV